MGKNTSLKSRTEAISKRLTPLIDKDDKSQVELMRRLSHQLAICEHCQELLEFEGLIVETARTIKPHPAVNIEYNATQTTIRLFGCLDLGKEVQSNFLDLD